MKKVFRLIFVLSIFIPQALYAVGDSIWYPKLNSTFHIQFSGNLKNLPNDVDIYDLDLFDTSKKTISDLHKNGKKVVCYTSVGSLENWRPDSKVFSSKVIGKNYIGWSGEKWLDIRNTDLLGPILQKRFDLAKEKGCDGIDADNMDSFNADTGFPLTSNDQIKFNTWVAKQVHDRGMSIGLKNDTEQTKELLPYFDWALIESCYKDGWCDNSLPFVALGKPVFQIEYKESKIKFDKVCTVAKKKGFTAILKNKNLDDWMKKCQ